MIERKKALAAAGRRHRRGLADRAVHRAAARPVRARPEGGGLMPVGPDGWFEGGKPIEVEGGIKARSRARHDRRAVVVAPVHRHPRGDLRRRAGSTAGAPYARKGQVLDLDLDAGPAERPGAGLARRAVPGRRSRSRRTTSAAWTRVEQALAHAGAVPGEAAGRRDADTRSWTVFDELGLPLFPVDAGHELLLPRLGRALQAPVRGALPAGRGVRRRPVPGAGLARPGARGAARRAARRGPRAEAAADPLARATTCRSRPARRLLRAGPSRWPGSGSCPAAPPRRPSCCCGRWTRRRSGCGTSRWSTCSGPPTASSAEDDQAS